MRKWVKRLSYFFGFFLLVAVLLFGIAVYRASRDNTSVVSPQTLQVKNFTEARVAPSPASTNVPIATNDDPSIGPANARVTVVEFSDFECPFCRQAFPIVRELMASYGDRVRFIYRDFPITQVHDNAEKAAEAGECAHTQGKFWPLHDKIFQNAPRMSVPDLKQYAREVGLNTTQFDTCLDSGTFANEVAQDYADGIALGVRGTPTWFFNGRKVEGVIPRDTFISILEQFLRVQ
ncbi:DsbA family protein [Candidatus Uhrbacteria bacterium]|nr:DsbA family protein [Candidatus Uhrbacteria bacterium]